MPKPKKPPTLGAVLRFFRFASGWSEKELARELGIRPSLISQYERGAKELSRERLEEFLAVLRVPPEAIDAALFSHGLAFPPEILSPEISGSPVDPSPAELRSLHQLAAVAGLKASQATLAKLTANLRRMRAAQARREAGKLWETLAKVPPARQRPTVEKERKYWNWALAERICAESERAAAHRAGRAVELASLALRIAELAPGGETWRSRLLGYVWAFVANSRRVLGDLPGADEAFLHSDGLWDAGAAADPGLLDGSRLFDLKASLRRYQGRFEEALSLLNQATQACGSQEAQGRIRIKKANILKGMGDYERAVAELRQAERVAEESRDPRHPFLVRFSLATNLLELERYTDIEALLPVVRELAVGLRNELDLMRVLWLEGRSAAGSGHREESLAALEQVRRYFTDHQIAFDAALASLDMAVLYLEEGRTAEVKTLAEEMVWIFKAQGVHDEALAALRLFCEAAKKEEATAALARRVAEYLRKAQQNPGLRFEGE